MTEEYFSDMISLYRTPLNDDHEVMQLFSGPQLPLIQPRLLFRGQLSLATRNEQNEQGLYAIIRGTIGIRGEGILQAVPFSETLSVNSTVYHQLQKRISVQQGKPLTFSTKKSLTLDDIAG